MAGLFRRKGAASLSGLGAVSRTAVGVARVRAAESARAKPLFSDPWAERFVELLGGGDSDDGRAELGRHDPAQAATRARIAVQVVVRTKFYDDWLAEAAAAGIRQVVLLGAGLDMRAFRLTWPAGTRLWELDLPPVLAAKDQCLKTFKARPAAERTGVPADLTGDWSGRLRAAGFDPRQPSAWVAEGLLVYLSRPEAEGILSAATKLAAPGSRLATESGESRQLNAAVNDTTRLWQGGLGAGTRGYLAGIGWSCRSWNLGDLADRYGRTLTTATDAGFVTAER